jgi:predicted  nucleic acid-binding Zn-ribbon protein
VERLVLKAFRNEELEDKLEELREEKNRLTDAFINGKIPQDVYKKTVMRLQTDIISVEKEIRRRSGKE